MAILEARRRATDTHPTPPRLPASYSGPAHGVCKLRRRAFAYGRGRRSLVLSKNVVVVHSPAAMAYGEPCGTELLRAAWRPCQTGILAIAAAWARNGSGNIENSATRRSASDHASLICWILDARLQTRPADGQASGEVVVSWRTFSPAPCPR